MSVLKERNMKDKFDRFMMEVSSNRVDRTAEIQGEIIGYIIDDFENKTETFVPATPQT